jgi:hypothetical protein
MQSQRNAADLEQILTELLERIATAPSLAEVNVAAGIALNELSGVDEDLLGPPHQPQRTKGEDPHDFPLAFARPGGGYGAPATPHGGGRLPGRILSVCACSEVVYCWRRSCNSLRAPPEESARSPALGRQLTSGSHRLLELWRP